MDKPDRAAFRQSRRQGTELLLLNGFYDETMLLLHSRRAEGLAKVSR